MLRNVLVSDFLTEAQIRKATALKKKLGSGELHAALVEQVIRPNMAEINRKTGQENDPSYLAYALEYALKA